MLLKIVLEHSDEFRWVATLMSGKVHHEAELASATKVLKNNDSDES